MRSMIFSKHALRTEPLLVSHAEKITQIPRMLVTEI